MTGQAPQAASKRFRDGADIMSTSIVLLQQLVIMFLYMAVGWILLRTGLVTKEGSRSLANLLLYVILPCVIVKSFCKESTGELSQTVLMSLVGAVIVLGLAMLIAHAIFRKRPLDDFGAAFSNAGFMGLPLISAVLGSDAVIYAAGMVALLNILQWTYGQAVISGDWSAMSVRKVLLNPLVISFAIGILIFFTGLPVPDLLVSCMGTVSGMNAPVAMIILGIYLGEVRIRDIFTERSVWLCTAVRLLLIPALTVIALRLVFPGQQEMALALVLTASAPVGANLAVYAQKLGKDYGYAVKTICLSTILSIVSMPLMLLLWESIA